MQPKLLDQIYQAIHIKCYIARNKLASIRLGTLYYSTTKDMGLAEVEAFLG